MSETVYMNGVFLPREDASIDLGDRGYQFADAVYEVIFFSNGTPFRLEEHFQRLERSASALRIRLPDLEALKSDVRELQQRNDLDDRSAKLYLQVSRGTQERHHEFDRDLEPNVVMTLSPFDGHPEDRYEDGVRTITVSDDRWARCHIKTTALISNGLAKTRAHEEGAFEAIFIRDGYLTEGTSSNVFIVNDGTVATPPPSNYILNGVTRTTVIEAAEDLGVPVDEHGIAEDELRRADEVFLTGTTTHVMPVVDIDGTTIGDGRPGEVTRTLLDRYRAMLP